MGRDREESVAGMEKGIEREDLRESRAVVGMTWEEEKAFREIKGVTLSEDEGSTPVIMGHRVHTSSPLSMTRL